LELLAERGARLFRLLYRLTLRADVAEDLLQELFLKLNDSPAWRQCRDPAAYATRTAVHLAYDWHRLQKRAPNHQALCQETLAEGASPLTNMIQRDDFQALLDALAQLPQTIHECLVLRHLENESYEDIARRFDKTPHQVRALCHKGITRMRELLNAEPALRVEREMPHDPPR
jgi:RNA polymerase sigma-70 factor (ECF subfamily)